MSYRRNSYGAYRQYRKNRRRYAVGTSAIPCLIMCYVLLNNLKFIIWLVLGIALIIGIYLWLVAMRNRKSSMQTSVHAVENKVVTNNMSVKEKVNMNTTDAGYINKNNQRNIGKTNQEGTDYNQQFYAMECLNCGHVYKANGSDIWQRKCPKCQGGKE